MAPLSRPPTGLDANCGPPAHGSRWSLRDCLQALKSSGKKLDPLAYNTFGSHAPAPTNAHTNFGSVEGGRKFGKALEPKWPHDNTHVEVVQPSRSRSMSMPTLPP